jgi:hypothetical protein
LFGSVHEESWTLEDRKADIVFYVDHSGSMGRQRSSTRDSFDVFMGS